MILTQLLATLASCNRMSQRRFSSPYLCNRVRASPGRQANFCAVLLSLPKHEIARFVLRLGKKTKGDDGERRGVHHSRAYDCGNCLRKGHISRWGKAYKS